MTSDSLEEGRRRQPAWKYVLRSMGESCDDDDDDDDGDDKALIA